MDRQEDRAARMRDRAATEATLVAAARDTLIESGFQGLGVNAVARRAGCDKQLIYRYFGGLEGLVDAVGTSVATDLRDRLDPTAAPAVPDSYAELIEQMLLGFLAVLRGDPLLRRLLVWEIAEPSPLLERLTLARSRALVEWVASRRGSLIPPPGIDAPAVNAVLIAAVQHLVLSGSAAGQFAGLVLGSETDWKRAEAAVKTLVRSVYRPGGRSDPVAGDGIS